MSLTVLDCKRKLFRLGIKLGVSPRLISTRLLSAQDKQDMLHDILPDDALEAAVISWMELGMPDYANGCDKPYMPDLELSMSRHRGIGKSLTSDELSG